MTGNSINSFNARQSSTRRGLYAIGAALALAYTVSCQTHLASVDQLPPLEQPPTDGITFATDPRRVYVPLYEATDRLGLTVDYDAGQNDVLINKRPFPYKSIRHLLDETALVNLTTLANAGASVDWDEEHKQATVRWKRKTLAVIVAAKRTEVSLAEQRLRAFQGNRLVLECRISSGRSGCTPSGTYTAGPYKARRHYSSLYQNAPMPWSVQVTGHIFIHGFTSVPNYPASHGCIRLPLNEGNPAKFFYEWVDKGTPIKVTRK